MSDGCLGCVPSNEVQRKISCDNADAWEANMIIWCETWTQKKNKKRKNKHSSSTTGVNEVQGVGRKRGSNKKDPVLVKWWELKAKFYNQREDKDKWREHYQASCSRSWWIHILMIIICKSFNKLHKFQR